MKIELRADNSACIEGYVNVVGRESRVIQGPDGPFVEVVAPNTFAKTLEKRAAVQLQLDHEKPLGGTDKGNLQLHEDNIGLYARAETSDEDVISAAKKKQLRGWSFSFKPIKQRLETRADGMPKRILTEIDMLEVSIIDTKKIPVYTATSIEMRATGDNAIEFRAIYEDESIEIIDNKPAKKLESGPDITLLQHKIKLMRMKGR